MKPINENRKHLEKDAASLRTIREMAEKYRFRFNKNWGQHFLADRNMLQKIVDAAELDGKKGALEIGPGLGALTQALAQSAGRVVAVEIDARLIPMLEETLAGLDHVHIIQGDVLTLDLHGLFHCYYSDMEQVSVVANLPYYITTPILMKILEERLPVENIVVMVQKEVAERITAKPGGKDYSSLSVAVQFYCHSEFVAFVPRTVFVPRPNVDSMVVKLKRRKRPPVEVGDESFFFSVVQTCFAQRRKTIFNNLRARFASRGQEEIKGVLLNVLERCDIEPTRRGETLTLEEFAKLANALQEHFR